MKKSGICPKCDCPRIISNATVLDRLASSQRDLELATFRNKNALIFDGIKKTTLAAWVCAACGYTELYAERPLDLVQAED